jgi:hypothetical protein
MGRCLYLAVIAASFVFSLQADVSSWQSKWTAFRQAYPYHIQAVAVSQPNSDGNRLLILSEPPPGIKPSDIYAIDPKSFGEMSLPRQRIGFDGWVQDAAIELKPMGEAQLSELVDKIHLRLFGTAYKAVAIGIPERPELVNRKYAFDLRVSAGTLKRWLLPEPVNSSKPLAWLVIVGHVWTQTGDSAWSRIGSLFGYGLLWRKWIYALPPIESRADFI